MSVVDLDDMAYLQSIDSDNMGVRVSELPMQCKEAKALAEAYSLPMEYSLVDAIVILGMGGSAIGGDLVRTLVQEECPIPILVHRDYGLPAFVNEHTMVIASSYSGDTEETLSAFTEALERGAWPLAITTGGKLGEICKEQDLPLVTFAYESQPRAALGYSFVPLLVILQQLKFSAVKSAELERAITSIEELQAEIRVQVPEKDNKAKQLARRLEGRLPVVYGARHLSEVARRWKCQFNENSKGWGFWEVLPELNHNAVVGYDFPTALAREVRVLMLSSQLYRPRYQVRLQVTGEILAEKGVVHEVIQVQGESPLSQVLWAIHFGDYVSYYLAALRGVDPTPVKTIVYLKERLAQVPQA
jgi:glucose/mannose-6-phosphate isomerase